MKKEARKKIKNGSKEEEEIIKKKTRTSITDTNVRKEMKKINKEGSIRNRRTAKR